MPAGPVAIGGGVGPTSRELSGSSVGSTDERRGTALLAEPASSDTGRAGSGGGAGAIAVPWIPAPFCTATPGGAKDRTTPGGADAISVRGPPKFIAPAPVPKAYAWITYGGCDVLCEPPTLASVANYI